MHLSVYKRYEDLSADFWENSPNQEIAINVPLFKQKARFQIQQ